MRTIAKRELQGYFYTPIAYVFIGVFLLLGSIFFIVGNLATLSPNLLMLLSNMSYLWMLLSPILTMRLFANDKKQGTDQLLFSSPVSLSGIVIGKFLAACAVLLCAVVLSLMYPALIAIYGKLYVKETLVGYLGFLLLGCSFIAVDMFVASFSKNQAVAALSCFGVNLLIWLSALLAQAVNIPLVQRMLQFISLYDRNQPFLQGNLSFANVLYSLSMIGIMLFLTVRMLDAKRWSEV